MSNRDDRIRRAADRSWRGWRCPGASSSGAPARCSAGSAVAPAVLGRVRRRATATAAARAAEAGGGEQVGRDLELDRATWTRRSKKDFPKDTGIDLTYDEDINANNEYFAKIRPNLSKDQSIGTRRLRASPTGWPTGSSTR